MGTTRWFGRGTAVAVLILALLMAAGFFVALRAGFFATPPQPSASQDASVQANDDQATAIPTGDVAPDAGGTSSAFCALTADDVKNVPEGWTTHVFPGPCIGLAFPSATNGAAYNAGVNKYGDWDGELLRLLDNADPSLADHTLEMMVIDGAVYENEPNKCSSSGMDGYVYCRGRIVDEWRATDAGNYVVYRPEPDQIEEQYKRKTVAVAAVSPTDGRFVTLILFERTGESTVHDLDTILKSLTIGKR